MPKKNTPNGNPIEQYKREYTRIQQAIYRQKKLGYVVPENLIPVAPRNISNVTPKMLSDMASLTPKKIRQNSYWVDSSTGETFYGHDVVKSHHKASPSKAKTRSKPSKKRSQTEEQELDPFFYGDDIEYVPEEYQRYYPGFENIAITGYYKQLQQFPNADGARFLTKWFSEVIEKYGRRAASIMLDEGSRVGNIVTWETVYKGGVEVYITNMMEHLPGFTENDKQWFGDLMEGLESWENPE